MTSLLLLLVFIANKSCSRWGQHSPMSLGIYFFTLYLILTFTKQYKQEVEDDLSICVDERRPPIIHKCS